MKRDAQTWANYGEAFAFLGNSLLAPMNQTGTVGLLPEFWQQFPTFGDVKVALCIRIAEALDAADGERAEEIASQLGEFVEGHPGAWIGRLVTAATEAAAGSYIVRLLELSSALLATV